MGLIQIPVSNSFNQSFTLALPLSELQTLSLSFFISWNNIANYWQVDISNPDGTRYVSALPLVLRTGVTANMLDFVEYLNIGKMYLLPLNNSTSQGPGLTDWGTNFILIWAP